MDQIEYAHTNMPNCNPYLQHFGCAIAAPKCNSNETARVPPCRELCEGKVVIMSVCDDLFLYLAKYLFNINLLTIWNEVQNTITALVKVALCEALSYGTLHVRIQIILLLSINNRNS